MAVVFLLLALRIFSAEYELLITEDQFKKYVDTVCSNADADTGKLCTRIDATYISSYFTRHEYYNFYIEDGTYDLTNLAVTGLSLPHDCNIYGTEKQPTIQFSNTVLSGTSAYDILLSNLLLSVDATTTNSIVYSGTGTLVLETVNVQGPGTASHIAYEKPLVQVTSGCVVLNKVTVSGFYISTKVSLIDTTNARLQIPNSQLALSKMPHSWL